MKNIFHIVKEPEHEIEIELKEALERLNNSISSDKKD